MEILKNLSPAQTYFILEKGNCRHKEFLRYTFLDLMLKGVLKTVQAEKQRHPSDPVSLQLFVDKGINYNGYSPRTFEAPLIRSFRFDDDMRVVFKNFIIVCRTNTNQYRKILLATDEIKPYVYQSFWHRFSGAYKYTPAGEAFAFEAERYLQKLNNELPELTAQNRLPEILKLIGGNILLLPNFTTDLMHEIQRQMNAAESADDGYYGPYGDIIYWDDSYHTFDGGSDWDFDSTFDAAESSSGCSGDSGCSGCSGCGGGD